MMPRPEPLPDRCLLGLTSDTMAHNACERWHYRLGHVSVSRLLEIRDKKLLPDVRFTDKEAEEFSQKICPGCAAGACSKKRTHNSSHGDTALPTGPLQQMHIDLIDFHTTPSRNGYKYALVLVDKFTRMVWVETMKSKSKEEGHAAFVRWRKRVGNRHGAHAAPHMTLTQTVRTDREGAFISKRFREYAANSGIALELTVSGENHCAFAEAAIRVIKAMTRSMLLRAVHLDMTFWAEALRFAVYVRNMLPMRALGNRTPYSIDTGKDVNVNHLRVFGSPCVVHVPREGLASSSMKRTVKRTTHG